MQAFVNKADSLVDEMLQGFTAAHRSLVSPTKHPRVVRSVFAPVRGKVGVVTGGGSGHEPAFLGYIGRNLLDAVAVGEVFSSPPADAFAEAMRAADGGKGVACLYGNYAGDNMNVKLAIDRIHDSGLEVAVVVANDDVLSAPESRSSRRGVAGEIFMWKVGAARAALGGSLDDVISEAQRAIDNTRSIGIGIGPCTIPEVGHPNFAIEPGTMEVGIGHHGEPGIENVPLESAASIAERMVHVIQDDLPFVRGDEVVVLLSGLGSTPLIQLYVLANEVNRLVTDAGLKLHRLQVGNWFTSLDMGGVTLSMMKLDRSLKQCIDLEVEAVCLQQFGERSE